MPASFLPLRAFALGFVAILLFAVSSRYPGYVHHDTSEIVMWSTLPWPLGLPKHPPLLPWLMRAYGNVIPLNWLTLDLATAFNIVVGAWAVWVIARDRLDERRAGLAALLASLSPAATFFALKFNHNAILVSLWPLTMLAFLRCLEASSMRASLAYGAAFGVAAAAAMLAKYYSGVLLACCFAASLVARRRNAFYAQPGGYLAVVVFAVLISPHALWMLGDRGSTLAYALHETEREAYPFAHFVLLAPTYALPVLAGFYLLWRMLEGGGSSGVARAGQLSAIAPELWALTLGPFVLTAILIAVFKLRGATSWSLPDFCLLPVLLATLLPVPEERTLVRCLRYGAVWLAIVACAGPVVLAISFAQRDANAVEPRAEIAQAGGRIFAAATGSPPALVAGEPKLANTAALVIASRPLAYTNFSSAFAPWVTPAKLASDGLLVLCAAADAACRSTASAILPGQPRTACRVTQARRWLWMQGRPFIADIVAIAGAGGPATTRPGDACAAAEATVQP